MSRKDRAFIGGKNRAFIRDKKVNVSLQKNYIRQKQGQEEYEKKKKEEEQRIKNNKA